MGWGQIKALFRDLMSLFLRFFEEKNEVGGCSNFHFFSQSFFAIAFNTVTFQSDHCPRIPTMTWPAGLRQRWTRPSWLHHLILPLHVFSSLTNPPNTCFLASILEQRNDQVRSQSSMWYTEAAPVRAQPSLHWNFKPMVITIYSMASKVGQYFTRERIDFRGIFDCPRVPVRGRS